MNKKLFSLIFTLILAFTSLKASAVMLTDDKIKAEIEKQVCLKYSKITSAQIEAKVIGIPFQSINLAAGKISYKVSLSSKEFLPRDLVKVEIYVNGKLQKVFNAPTVIKAYENVLIASSIIHREKPITRATATVGRREISNNFNHVLREDAFEKEYFAKKYFKKGEIIDDRYVKSKPEVLRNTRVTVFFNTNNLTVSLDGIALSDGIKGERITVLNKEFNRIYKGTVIGENRVLVKI